MGEMSRLMVGSTARRRGTARLGIEITRRWGTAWRAINILGRHLVMMNIVTRTLEMVGMVASRQGLNYNAVWMILVSRTWLMLEMEASRQGLYYNALWMVLVSRTRVMMLEMVPSRQGLDYNAVWMALEDTGRGSSCPELL